MCTVDGQDIVGDIYLHQTETILGVDIAAFALALAGVLLVLLVAVAW
jgi:hypothetical protein